MMREWILGASFLAGMLWPVPTWAQSAEEQIAGCVACHGEDGRPNAPEVPVIFGQQEGYPYCQLRDFKSGARRSEVMHGIASDLTKDTMKALAAYFATKTWPRLPQAATAEQAAVAARTANSGMCTSCHMEGYLGASTAPRLAGQQQAYLERTLVQFKTKERANNPAMSALVETYPDADIEAIAHYLGSL
jgi:cytochrome c553